MRTTGIVRRIDELGRVVIPKEIRKTMRIKEGEELEVLVQDDALLLKKYSPVKNVLDTVAAYCNILGQNTGYTCLMCNMDEFVAASAQKERFLHKRISNSLEKQLRTRQSGYFRSNDGFSLIPGDVQTDIAVAPIVYCGDVVGGMILTADSPMSRADSCVKLLEVGASFFAEQL